MPMDKFSRKAKFEQIKYDIDAVKFHADKYSNGSVYQLAKDCYQLVMYLNARGVYQRLLDAEEGRYGAGDIII